MTTKTQNTDSNNKSTFLNKLKNHKLRALLILIVLVGALFTGYNKYLDWRNVQDMKELLSSIEQLKQDVETETGQKLAIEASCGSGGVFASFYSCDLYLKSNGEIDQNYTIAVSEFKDKSKIKCEILINGKNDYKNILNCRTYIRKSNRDQAETIFFQYDTSPGRAV